MSTLYRAIIRPLFVAFVMACAVGGLTILIAEIIHALG